MKAGVQPLSEAFLYASPERLDAMSFTLNFGLCDGFATAVQDCERGWNDDHEAIN
ncbi:MAG: hypothetical protein KDI68_07210 [Gammaproteobacteria bacterium]|nr:hypothetical protein [Gammaproteobacteria bacterium]